MLIFGVPGKLVLWIVVDDETAFNVTPFLFDANVPGCSSKISLVTNDPDNGWLLPEPKVSPSIAPKYPALTLLAPSL